ncbi:putative RNA-directed DNA polymerase, eukaryota, reverse transcriptase zinc-binding domain protein [Tanacetum coccineum]
MWIKKRSSPLLEISFASSNARLDEMMDDVITEYIDMVKNFETDGFIPRGCNSSFIALVPKIQDPLHTTDYRPISLIGCQYKVIAKVLANRLLQVVGSVVSDVQTTFIKGRQIVDGPLMVNEIIAWAKNKKRRLFLLKVDFEKAFDSLDWNFLDNIMMQMNFSQKWRMWIKGVKKRRPLISFLIHFAVEALHVTFLEAKAKDIFKGVKVGNDNVEISHLQFTDDALILGEWSHENAKNLCRLLRCFHLASRLKVNFSKSKIFGVGATVDDTNLLASILCCQPFSPPFTYLGLPIGANMNRSCNWKPIIDKFHNCLSSWKVSYLEKPRRNFFWGGSVDNKKLACVAWKQVCSSKDCGGLGIGSLLASNLAIFKRYWLQDAHENQRLVPKVCSLAPSHHFHLWFSWAS